MIITTKRSRLRYLLDILLTTLGWVAFVYLFGAGIVAILSGEMSGLQAPIIPPLLLSSAETVINYIVVALINANVLIGWAVYNQFRFVGKDRRKPTPPLTEGQLQKSFTLSPALFNDVQKASVMVVYHEENNMVCTIDVLKENTKQDANSNLQNIPQTAKNRVSETV